MNKNRTGTLLKIFLALLFVIGVLVVITTFSYREPTYEGKTLNLWLKDLEEHGTDSDSPPAIAIKNMGPATIPHLLDTLSGEGSGIRKKMRRLADRFQINVSVGKTDYMTPVTASYALNVLGTNAEPAFVALTNLFYEKNAVCSAIALAGIGSKGTEFLLSETINRDPRLRHSAVNALGEAKSDYADIINALTNILTVSKEPLIRSAAANSLGRLHRYPESTIPALVEGVSDKDANVRGMAIFSLGQFGPQARAGIPALTNALNDPDPVNVELAMRALEKVLSIRPESTAR